MVDGTVSNTAGVLLLALEPSPAVLLVLNRAEEVPQSDGMVFSKPRMWGIPKGRSKVQDEDVAGIALREFYEETGIKLDRALVGKRTPVFEDVPSLRPGSDRHRKTFFLAILGQAPTIGKPIDEKIEQVRWFSLGNLPSCGKIFFGATLAKSHARLMADLFIGSFYELEGLGIRVMEALMDIQPPPDKDEDMS